MNKKEANDYIEVLKASCEEGMSGEWDCSPEGFEEMIYLLDQLKAEINKK